MENFTYVGEDSDLQNLNVINELVQSYNEHVDVLAQVHGAGTMGKLKAGDDCHGDETRSLVNTIQCFLEQNCHFFVNHVDGPLNAAGTDFLYYDIPSWRAAAKLNPNGFQYSQDGYNMGYSAALPSGNVNYGDIYGPWNFSDLQKGLSVLRYTMWPVVNVIDYKGRTSGSQIGYEAAVNAWKASNWIEHTLFEQYVVWVDVGYNDGGDHIWNASRSAVKLEVIFPPGLVGRDLKIYGVGGTFGGYTFYDLEKKGIEAGKYTLLQTIGNVNDYTTPWLGDEDDCPLVVSPETSGWDRANVACSFAQKYLAHWNFSYQND